MFKSAENTLKKGTSCSSSSHVDMDLVLVWYWKSNVFCLFCSICFPFCIHSWMPTCFCITVFHGCRFVSLCYVLMHDASSAYRCLLMAFRNILLSCIQLSFLFCFSEAKIQRYWLTFLFIMRGWIASETLRYKLLVQLVFSFPRCCLPNLSKKCFKMLWRSGSADCWLWCYSPGVPR